MNDLIIGVLIMGLLSAILLIAMLRISRALSTRMLNLMAILVVATLLANALFLTDSILLTRILPVSNLIIVGNFSPLLVAILAGLIWRRVPPPALRRVLVVGALVIICLVTIYRPILSSPPQMSNRWSRGVCLQTSNASCSAAAAATLLGQYGIPATEDEMAGLCLTSERGTSVHGLWRGLRLKAQDQGMDVYMFEGAAIDDLRGNEPVLLSVELRADANVDPRYANSWGWLPGVPHSVVLLKFLPGDQVLMGDPAIGREVWSIQALQDLWHGQGARLIRTKQQE